MVQHVLVTGGAGYIGSMTCKILCKKGYIPVALDNLLNGNKNLVKFGPLEQGDIGDTEFITKVVKKYKPIAVIHLAANTDVSKSIINPYDCYNNNFVKTNNLIKVLIKYGPQVLVFASTAAVFGNINTDWVRENDFTNPINPYGRSKLMVEQVLHDYDHNYNLKYSVLRCFNVAGADPDLEVGLWNIDSSAVIPSVLRSVFNDDYFYLNGNNHNTKDGSCERDFIHVYDLAIANVLSMEKTLYNNVSSIMNIGNGHNYSIKEIIKTTEHLTGMKVKLKVSPQRLGDPVKVIADNKVAKDYLEWEPKYKDLKSQIQHSILWYKKLMNIR